MIVSDRQPNEKHKSKWTQHRTAHIVETFDSFRIGAIDYLSAWMSAFGSSPNGRHISKVKEIEGNLCAQQRMLNIDSGGDGGGVRRGETKTNFPFSIDVSVCVSIKWVSVLHSNQEPKRQRHQTNCRGVQSVRNLIGCVFIYELLRRTSKSWTERRTTVTNERLLATNSETRAKQKQKK